MDIKNENYDEYAFEIAEARIQRVLLQYEYIKYKASTEVSSQDYQNFE